jgi:hypothetical protein
MTQLRRNLFEHEMGERKFMELNEEDSLTNPEVDMEYLVTLDARGNYEVPRESGVIASTTSTHRYRIGGTILIKPEDKREEDFGNLENFDVDMFYQSGDGKGTKASRENEQSFNLGRSELEGFCQKYFPRMGMIGKVVIAADDPLPGDTPAEAFGEFIVKALKGDRRVQQLSEAHKTFLGTYAKDAVKDIGVE